MVLYFAYGSNMNQKDLDDYCKRKLRPLINLKFKKSRICTLKDYRLEFNYYSRSRRGGVANIEHAQGEQVEGVLFEISDDDKQTISQKEGAPTFYCEIPVSVTLRDGTVIENVLTYMVCDNKKRNEFTPPTREYMQIMIDGAKAFGLSEQWIEKLGRIPCSN